MTKKRLARAIQINVDRQAARIFLVLADWLAVPGRQVVLARTERGWTVRLDTRQNGATSQAAFGGVSLQDACAQAAQTVVLEQVRS